MTSLIVSNNNDSIMDLIRPRIHSRIDSSLTVEQQEAQENHYSFVEIAKLGKQAGLALRYLAAHMYETAGYKELSVPYPNNPTQMLSFNDFENWISFAVEQAGLSDTTTSTLKNFIINVIDPVSKRLIINRDTGLPYEVADVLGLRESHTQKLASAARRTLRDDQLNDEEKMNTISELLQIAADPTVTQDDFILELRNRSLAHRRNDPFEAKIAHANGKTAILILVDESKELQVNTALEGRSLLKHQTVDDLVGDLMAIQVVPSTDVSEVEEGSYELPKDTVEPTEAEFNDYLKDM